MPKDNTDDKESFNPSNNNFLGNKSLAVEVKDLQIKVAHLELTMDSLDDIIAKQDKQLQDMQRQIQLIFNEFNGQSTLDANKSQSFDMTDEVPPHY